jgi:hypothetical protein
MLPPKLPGLSGSQQKLLKLHRQLSEADQAALLSFAEYLVHRATSSDTGGPEREHTYEPQAISRPDDETVIAAIRRLTATYPMLDRDSLLHETADLMSAHVLQGRGAVDVIDELEVVFRRHYERVHSRRGKQAE